MSEQLNKLVVNIPQNFSSTEKQQGRENLGISGEGWLVPDRPTPANDLMLTTDTLGAMQWESKASNEGIKPSQLSSYILAGSNITITPSSSSITISSTGGGQTYSAGAGINIVNNEIAAKTDNSTIMVNVDGELEANIPAQQQSNWTESDNTSPSFILNKPDLSVYMQPSQLSSYIVAGSNMNITTSGSTLTLNATAAPQVQSDWAETDPADASYIVNKPAIPVVPSMKPLVAGSNVSIVEGTNDVTISATAAPQLQANWNETSTSSVQYIQNKPTIPTLPTMKPLVAGSNITITEGVSDVTIAAAAGTQVQSNWTESDNTDPSYIQNKPTLATVATSGSYSDLTGKPTIPAEQVNSDWSAQTGKAQILNKPITMPNATGGLRKTLDADDITNGYVEFKISTGGSYTGPYNFTNPAFVLFGNLSQLRYNSGIADNYIDMAEVGLYSEGFVNNHIKYYENSHAELVADSAKGWGIGGWWSLDKDKYVNVYVKLTLTSSAVAGDEVFCHFTSGIFGTGLFPY